MSLEHFSHPQHSLLLKSDYLHDDGTHVSCYGCQQPIKGPSYGCKGCMFFLHISCAALPEEITHPYHPQHPLSLHPNPPNRYFGCRCDVCGKDWDRFVYHCFACNFDVDIKCASMVVHIQKKIKHESHPQHELIPLQKLIKFLCDACGTPHRDTSYLCTTCGFWISQKCAALPTTIQLIPDHHHHPLTLIYSIPSELYEYTYTCGICDKKVYRRNWVYWCPESECKYIVHVNNAIKSDNMEEEPSTLRDCKTMTEVHDTSQISLFINSDASDIRTTNFNNETEITNEETVPLQLPFPDHESIDLTISKFIKDMVMRKVVVTTNHTDHYHQHPLIFCNEQIDHDEKCEGCGLSINTINSTPFYHCDECDFLLHEWCAKSPNEIQHPCHPEHPLDSLYLPYKDASMCHCCFLGPIQFVFGCSRCEFHLDIKCASLPHTIKHVAHNHVLALRSTWFRRCSVCNSEFPGCGFVCDSCSLEICARCALLPRTVEHRYDKHPFYLKYSPCRESDDDDDLCEICEEDLDSKLWFYHCSICDKSLHTQCIFPDHPYPFKEFV